MIPINESKDTSKSSTISYQLPHDIRALFPLLEATL